MNKKPTINPYFTFGGNADEAINFYIITIPNSKFIEAKYYKDIPGMSEELCKQADGKLVYHCDFVLNNVEMMGADIVQPDHKLAENGVVTLACHFASEKELTDTFAKFKPMISKVIMEPQDTPWGAFFGIFNDKFGVTWQFHFMKS